MGMENKSRYIDADDLDNIAVYLDTRGIIRRIEAPTADVTEVKHGYWIDTTAYCGEFTCSICKETCITNKYKYCPHCGAKMDEKENL